MEKAQFSDWFGIDFFIQNDIKYPKKGEQI